MPLKLVPQRDRKLYGLFKEGREVTSSRGRILYEQGSPAESLYLVREGHVRITLRCSGKERTVAVAGPWEIFGEEALSEGGIRAYGARAGEPMRVQAVPGPSTFRAMRSTRRTLPLLVQAWGRDLLRARWDAPGSTGATTAQRLADLLTELASRFGEEWGRGIRVPHWFTHAELADLVGAHRSTITTQLNEWIYEGTLKEGERELIIARPAELRKMGTGREKALSR